MQDSIQFILTKEQAETLCNYYNKDINTLQDFEICSLLDRYIDEID